MSPRCRAAKPPAAHGLVFFALSLVPTPTPTLNDLSHPCRGIIGPRRGHRPEDAGVLVAKQLDAAWLVLLQEFTYGLLATTIAPAAFSPKLRAKIFSSATCSLSDPGPRSNAASPRRLGACVWAVAMWPASIAGRRGNWWKGEMGLICNSFRRLIRRELLWTTGEI